MQPEPRFTLQRQGERKPSEPQSLEAMLEANRDDPDVVEWLQRAQPGGGLLTGGGAQPIVSIRRVS